jgi:hypothetical protein
LETDFNLTWSLSSVDEISIETACFFYGDYFEDTSNPALRVAAGYRRFF